MVNMSRLKRSEETEQICLMAWCRLNEKRYPELALIYHIPNGGSRNKLEAIALKKQGVKAGVPDLCLPVARGEYHGLYIEMKFGKNKTTQFQDEWLAALQKQNYKAVVCYGAEEAMSILKDYLKIIQE